ncbi:MAG: aldo/keto reductase, partial [Bacteroidota bacterium]
MNDITITIKEEEVPAIGLGTWLLRGNSCIDTVKKAVSLGYRLIDTAQNYDNEREVGEGIQRAEAVRKNIFLITKLNPANFAYNDTLRTTKESCHKLSVNYIDLVLLHWPNMEIPLQETLQGLAQLQKEGIV